MKGWGGLSPRKRTLQKFIRDWIEKGWRGQCEFCRRVLPTRKHEEELTESRLQQIKHGAMYLGQPLEPWDYVASALECYGALIENTGYCTDCQKIVDKDTKPAKNIFSQV